MKTELDAYLTKNYPILFGDRYGDMRQTCMCWGFSCGDGWFDLLNEAAAKLEPLCRAIYEKEAVKEKSWYKYARLPAAWAVKVPLVGDHLFNLIYKTLNFIQPNIYNNAIYYFGGPPCRASQVKEKFGTLRFYMTSSSDEMEAIIREAERKSAVTCEECGKKGKLRGRGWLYTACGPCAKKREKQ